MQRHQTVNIRQISQNRAEQVGYYRFLENPQVTECELIRSLADHCERQVSGLHVLSISDTSEINLQGHSGRLKSEGLGVVGNNRDVGFFIHPSLVLNAETGFPLGLSDVHLWSRAKGHASKHERNYSALPIEDKESYKWLRSAEYSNRCLRAGDAEMITHIGDRESDIYEEWATVADRYTHLLIRVCRDRRLLQQSASLYELLGAQPCEGTYSLQVEADPRRQRSAREAFLLVRRATVEIQRPDKVSAQDYPPSVRLYAVEACEVSPPTGQKPIHWRLLTTHEVVSIEQALQVIQWYCWRWRIERLFATLKQAGMDIESTQLESVEAIRRLTILALSVSLKALQLVMGREQPDLCAQVAFTQEELTCLTQLAPQLQGATAKQQNPFPQASLPWVTWLIARLGGWSGYRSQRPPGTLTLVTGLRQFEAIFLGWQMASN